MPVKMHVLHVINFELMRHRIALCSLVICPALSVFFLIFLA